MRVYGGQEISVVEGVHVWCDRWWYVGGGWGEVGMGGGRGAIKTYFNQFLIYYLLKRKRHDTRKDLYNDLYYTSTTGIF